MSVTSGFFNSIGHDRRYDATQLSSIFDGIINDGVFATVGDAFAVTASGGNIVSVGVGRAWFNHIWVYNDSSLLLELDDPEVLLNRRDAIVIEINYTESVRAGTIKVVKGTPSSSSTPPVPTFIHTETVNQYPIALVTRTAEASAITQSNIAYCVGQSAALTPFVTGILETVSIDAIVAQWQAEWAEWSDQWPYWQNQWEGEMNQWYTDMTSENEQQVDQWLTNKQTEFDNWFNGLQTTLSGDVAANLAAQIQELRAQLDTLANEQCIYQTVEDSDGNPIESSDGSTITGKIVYDIK